MTPTAPPLGAGPAARLLGWFDHHGRKSLPWQQHVDPHRRDPYGIWVAEIMLQQTQVSTVIPYYRKFMARFPDIATLAHCDTDALLHCWSGLGYYARARNLQAAARQIVARHGGRFPDRFEEVLALPGIGRSTAGAILAFAFEQRHPVLDGNIRRVLTRYYAIAAVGGRVGGGKVEARLWEIADRLTPETRVADYNQALMDLGATVCRPTKPRCACCPLGSDCAALARGDPTAFPQPKPKTHRPRKSVTMLVVKNRRGAWLLVKRPPSGIWGGLWSLPEYADGDSPLGDTPMKKPPVKKRSIEKQAIEKWFEQQFGLVIAAGQPLPPVRHSFTHFDLDIRPLPATLTQPGTQSSGQSDSQSSGRIMDAGQYLWYNSASPAEVGLPTAVKRILRMCDES